MTRDFAAYADFEVNVTPETDNEAASTRIDPAHTPEPDVVQPPARRRRAKSTVNAVEVAQASGDESPTPVFRPEPADAVPEIVVNHAHDLALHLAERLREVERRELAAAEYETKLQEAEAAARVWVCQRDLELSALERELHLKSDDIKTQSAAVAAAELAAEQELLQRHGELGQRAAELDRVATELEQREEQLHAERCALDQAMDKLRAERRREEELHRARQQKWHALMEGDRAQAERVAANLHKHRLALEDRERALSARQQTMALPAAETSCRGMRSEHALELSALRAQAARDHRLALEHRWIAGQLWARLTGSGLAGDDELQDSLELVRGQLEMMYRREREALEDLQADLAQIVRQATPAPRERRPVKPRVLAFTA